MTTRFLVAKYLPDPLRLEPKNIGIVAWSDGQVHGQFLGERGPHITAPAFINKHGRDAYQARIASWKLQFSKDSLPLGRGKPNVARTVPEFLDALRLFTHPHYLLVDGGIIPEASGNVHELVSQLFQQLVAEGVPERSGETPTLKQRCKVLFRGLAAQGLRANYSIRCTVANGPEEDFPFSYALTTDSVVRVLLQEVILSKADLVNSAALKFRCVTEDEKLLSRDRCVSLIDMDETVVSLNSALAKHQAMLTRFSEVINLGNMSQASARLRQMGMPVGSPA